MRQWVKVVFQDRLRLGRAKGQLARHQQRVVLAFGAGAHLQHRADKGLNDGRQRLFAVAGLAGCLQTL